MSDQDAARPRSQGLRPAGVPGGRGQRDGRTATPRRERDRLAFWAAAGPPADLGRALHRGAGLVEPAVRQVVRRRQAQRRLQLRRPPRRGRPRRQGRHSLGGRARRPPRRSPTPSSRTRSARPRTRSNELGVAAGDRVAIYLPMVPEAVVAMLACARIGAPHTVVFGGFSADALRQPDRRRRRQAGDHRRRRLAARQAVGAEAGRRRGAAKLGAASPVEHVLVVRRTGQDVAWNDGPRRLVARPGRRRSPAEHDARGRSTPSTRCSSCTRRARPGSRRASCTPPAGT